MKFSWKNIENWQSWKMSFFWGGHFEFSKSAILNFFLLHLCEKSSPFIWGIIFFCTMEGFFRILKKTSFQLFCTRLYAKDRFIIGQTTQIAPTGCLNSLCPTSNQHFLWKKWHSKQKPLILGSWVGEIYAWTINFWVVFLTQPLQPHI